MNRGLLVAFLMTATLSVGGTGDNWTSGSSEIVDERIGRMLDKLSRKSYSDDHEILQSIFKKTQKEFLHRYKQYSRLDELAAGDFDCLTATSLFAEILERAGFGFRIMETNYHIFLLVTTSRGEVLIETTDRFQGFIDAPDAISKKIVEYRSQRPTGNSSSTAYQYKFDLYNEISPMQLSGLLHFNQAVKAYNDGEWLLCSEKIVLAENYCKSPRSSSLASLLLCAISLNEVSDEEKSQVIQNLKKIERKSGQAIASR